jgi:DNA-binding transcriptional LysR family regulator
VEFAWLEDFGALARSGNFSRAASARGVTQPAFSRRIRALEEWLGVQLVNRDTHRITLTAAGERFVAIGEAALRTLEHGRRELREIADNSASVIKILATHALSFNFFPQWLASMHSEALGEFPVQLTANNMSASENMMLQGKAHFCLCHFHVSAPSVLDEKNFSSITLSADTLIPVSAPGPDGSSPLHAISQDQEKGVSYLSYGIESGMGRILAATLKISDQPLNLMPVFTSHAALVLAGMARNGQGLAWLPSSMVAADLDKGALVRAGDERWDIEIDVKLYRPRGRQSASAEAFWRTARAKFGVIEDKRDEGDGHFDEPAGETGLNKLQLLNGGV